MSNPKQGMSSIYLAYVLKGEAIPVTESLDRFREFAYIDDVVDAWMRALDDPATQGRTFNLVTGRSITLRELLRLILAAAGRYPDNYLGHEVAAHAGGQFRMRADVSAFMSATGWALRVSLEHGIRRMTDWARAKG